MKRIFIVAGETSGDRQAANLVQAIKQIRPDVQFTGLGGKYMQAAGVNLTRDITDLAVVGFFEVLRNLGKFKEIFSQTVSSIKEMKPACCILVDYPGFNLELAREIKKIGIPVVYYISPQVWAWHKSRVKLIKKYVDKMIVLFEFEKEFYKQFNIEAEFVGHPLLDSARTPSPLSLKDINLSEEKITIALLPGSRKKEIRLLLPIMLESAQVISKADKRFQFLFIKANSADGDTELDAILDKFKKLPLATVGEEKIYQALDFADFAIVASGTATLETALMSKPMIIIYKLNLISWLLAKLLIKIPYIGLVNVVAQEKIVPELIQFEARPKKIANLCLEILANNEEYENMCFKLQELKKKLGAPGASQRAAKIVADLIKSRE